jgi:3-hydroxypropanoate dehydrogenase
VTTTFTDTDRAIDTEAADALFREAHTAYGFTDQPVTRDQLAEIYELVKNAPTAMNTQPLRITFITTSEAKARLLPHLAEGNRAKAQSAPVVAILAADTEFHEFLPRVLPQAPGAKDMFADVATRTKAAMFNASMQAGYFILAVRATGLDAGPLGGIDALGIDGEFFAGTGQKAFLVVNIGHATADGTFPRNPRLEHDEAVTVL